MESPLRLQVAVALGWCRLVPADMSPEDLALLESSAWTPEHAATWHHPETGRTVRQHLLPRYDTNWNDAGPLIERLGIAVWPQSYGWAAELRLEERAQGTTPLIAVCNLLLALHAAGKLHPAAEAHAAL